MIQKTVHFHIGTVKTGSTYLQKTMWENRAALEAEGVDYLQVTPPALDLPRYANANFLDDPAQYQRARKLIENSPCDRVIISEEGLFGRPQLMMLPIFDGFRKEVIIYIRRPAEVVSSWAAELTAPYNAFVRSFPWHSGLMQYDIALQMASNIYAACMGRCFSIFARADFARIVVRPFEREQLVHGTLVDDFLTTIDVNSASFTRRVQTNILEPVNPTRSRKFYDVSYLVWKYMQDRGRSLEYSHDLVERVFVACQSGDDRPPIETIDDQTINDISLELAFVEEDLANRRLAPVPFFRQRMPRIYRTAREPLQPVSPHEVWQLTASATQQLVRSTVSAGKEGCIGELHSGNSEFD